MNDGCPSEEILAAFAGGACDEGQAADIRRHLVGCPQCAKWLADAATDEALCHRVVAALDAYAQDPAPAEEGVRNLLPERPEGCFAQKIPDPFFAADAWMGRTIGGFHIERVLAAGGMGTVYLAQQDHPRRPVALKLMKPGLLSRQALRRFEYESQILARLRHPNIAQVYEAGTHPADPNRPPQADEGAAPTECIPYFVMEYIPDARTITAYAADHDLSVRQRVELFLPVCDAVHHGHQKGIIHRDLKPANLLVDAAGLVKVIDFGVARSTDSDVAATLHTEVGQLVGTLQYMSPEQCRADPHDLDTRSDVYSLGVVLYELLCGRPPYDLTGTTPVQALRIITEQEPARPRAKKGSGTYGRRGRASLPASRRKWLGRSLALPTPFPPRDLEAIVLKALEKDRARRYASADALARDLRHYLAGEPIEARPPTAWTRALRWAARHPKLTTAGVCLFIAMTTIVATYLAGQLFYQRPYAVEVSEDTHEAILVSYGKTVLHHWKAPDGSFAGGHVVERPGEFGGGILTLIAVGGHGGDGLPPGLHAFAEGEYSRAEWSSTVDAKDVPASAPPHDYTAGTFGCASPFIADIFPQHPGQEVVATLVFSPYALRLVRILGLDGKILYEVWYYGDIVPSYWMSGAGLLLCAGSNAEHYVEHYGFRGMTHNFPKVVFAIRPRLGVRVERLLDTRPGENDASPAWYYYLHPIDVCNASWPRFARSEGRDARRFVTLSLEITTQAASGGLNLVLDEYGQEVPDLRVLNDDYRRNCDLLPNHNLIELRRWPPPIPTSRPSEHTTSAPADAASAAPQ